MTITNYADDIRDIIGVPLNNETLRRFKIPLKVTGDKASIYFMSKENKVFVSTEPTGNLIEVEYLHQLQNFVSSLTGVTIIDHKKFRI